MRENPEILTSKYMSVTKTFCASLLLCTSSSGIVFLSLFWFVDIRPFPLSLSPNWRRGVLSVFLIGTLVGFFKSLIVSAIALQVKPHLRWRTIVVSTAVLTLLEGWFYYKLLTWTFPFG